MVRLTDTVVYRTNINNHPLPAVSTVVLTDQSGC